MPGILNVVAIRGVCDYFVDSRCTCVAGHTLIQRHCPGLHDNNNMRTVP